MTQRFFKIRGRSLEEAYRKMRGKFGAEAVVVGTHQVQEGGFFGFFGEKLVEITVSVPARSLEGSGRTPTPVERKYMENSAAAPAEATGDKQNLQYLESLVREAQHRMNAPSRPAGKPRAAEGGEGGPAPLLAFPQKKAEESSSEPLRRELQEIREMMQVLYAENPGAGLPAEFAPHYRALLDRGVSRKAAASLMGAVVKESDLAIMRDNRVFQERLQFELRKSVRTSGGLTVPGGGCRRVALCGATGVGKTTTLAKLAAQFAIRNRRKVALVTADTYRIAACEQLRVYANIIGVPLHVANDIQEMADLVRELHDMDLVLIDTPGGSQFNLEQISELKTVLQAARPHETLLAMTAGTPLDDLRNVVANFRCLQPTSLVFTKLDETRQYGALYSLLAETGLALGYICVGQNVPDDIRIATPDMVARLVMEGKWPRE